jgi:putative hydrolase
MHKPLFPRFHDLDRRGVNVEWQLHTNWTDGEPTIEEVLQTASSRQLRSVAFTEHVRKETDWFPAFARAVKTASQRFPELETFVACETKAMDTLGQLDVSSDVLRLSDLVMGVVHRFPDGAGGYLDFKSMSAQSMAEMECELSLGMIRFAPIDVLGHPGGMYQRRFGAFPTELFAKLFEAVKERDIAIEINASYLVDMPAFLAMCRDMNPRVSIGSDAHKTSEIGRCRDLLTEALSL